MSVDFVCGSDQAQAALAAYLYGECDAAERAAVEAHLAVCVACSAELAALGATRSALASWAPPETELGFRVVSDRESRSATALLAAADPSANVLRPARWWQKPLPAWAQAAAAILIFAAGGLLGMRAGSTETTVTPVVASAPVEGAVSTISAQDLAALEQRLRREMTAMRVTAPAERQAPQLASSDEQLLKRVQALLAESEARQERQMAIRLSQVLRDVDVQRRMDLARIEDTFGQVQGIAGAELEQQREIINYLQRVSLRRPE
jgi:anti-sigma factor RsiW